MYLLENIWQIFFEEILTFQDEKAWWLLTIPVFLLGLRICIKYIPEKKEEIEKLDASMRIYTSYAKSDKNWQFFYMYLRSIGSLILVTGVLIFIAIYVRNKTRDDQKNKNQSTIIDRSGRL